jgi:polar amino acid transport system substrate-binding protein
MNLAIDPDLRTELAPRGRLRIALNLGNFLLVSKATGALGGVAADIGGDIAARLGVPFDLVAYETAGKVADAAAPGEWDVAFIGAEPARENVIAFSPAYVEIEATYLVPAGSPIGSIDEVDRAGVRIATADRSAYDLFLSRTIRHATLVRAPGIPASFDLFVADKLDVLSGLKPRLIADQARLPGSRLLDGRFTAIQQSIGTPRPRTRAAQWLAAYSAEIRRTGLVADAIRRHGVVGLTVAP